MAERDEFDTSLNRPADGDPEALLRRLRPRASGIDRDRLMFLAGQASAELQFRGEHVATEWCDSPSRTSTTRSVAPQLDRARRRWLWPAATSLATCASIVLAVLLANRPEPRVVREIVYVERPVPPSPDTSVATSRQNDAQHVRDRADDTRPASAPRRLPAYAGPADSYLALREIALTQGVDALPKSSGGGESGAAVTSRELLETMLKSSEPETRDDALPRSPFFGWPLFGFQGESL